MYEAQGGPSGLCLNLHLNALQHLFSKLIGIKIELFA